MSINNNPAKIITSSAPGKVILHGEYAVVFGKNALAVSVDLRTKVVLELLPNNFQNVKIKFDSLGGISRCWDLSAFSSMKLPESESFVEFTPQVGEILDSLIQDKNSDGVDSFRVFLFLYLSLAQVYEGQHAPMNIVVDSEFPVGAGLGSSAAFSVALTGALLKAISPKHADDLILINRWSYQCERLFHGRPSGIDNSISTFGGAILFKEGQIVEKLNSLQNKNITLVYTNVRRNTKLLVEKFANKRTKFPTIIGHTLDAIDNVSLEAWKLLKEGNSTHEDGDTLVEINQHLLQILGAGHETIDTIVKVAKKYGCSAKLTGAGGGGCVVINISDKINKNQLVAEIEGHNFKCWTLAIGGSGLSANISLD